MPGERLSTFALTRDLVPFDANIDHGLVVCHAQGSVTINGVSVPTTDRSVVLPNHAAARQQGRAFAGVCQGVGDQPNVSVATPLDLTVDKQILVQKNWIAECRLKTNTACAVNDFAAYDPADGGVVVPFTSDQVQVCIGRFTETVQASSSRRLVGVELFGAGGGLRKGLLAKIAGPSGANAGVNNADSPYDKSITIPANALSPGQNLRVRGLVRSLSGGANASVVKVRLGGATGQIIAAGPSVTLGDQHFVSFDILLDLRASADRTVVPVVSSGSIGAGAAGTATMRVQGAAAANQDLTAALVLLVQIAYTTAGAGDSTQLETLSLSVEG